MVIQIPTHSNSKQTVKRAVQYINLCLGPLGYRALLQDSQSVHKCESPTTNLVIQLAAENWLWHTTVSFTTMNWTTIDSTSTGPCLSKHDLGKSCCFFIQWLQHTLIVHTFMITSAWTQQLLLEISTTVILFCRTQYVPKKKVTHYSQLWRPKSWQEMLSGKRRHEISADAYTCNVGIKKVTHQLRHILEDSSNQEDSKLLIS